MHSEPDILTARRKGWALAMQWGFSAADATLISSVISELSRGILQYARQGEIILRVVEQDHRRGIEVVARDDGLGLLQELDVQLEAWDPAASRSLGLSGVKRVVDQFEIVTALDQKTTVTVMKWRR